MDKKAGQFDFCIVASSIYIFLNIDSNSSFSMFLELMNAILTLILVELIFF